LSPTPEPVKSSRPANAICNEVFPWPYRNSASKNRKPTKNKTTAKAISSLWRGMLWASLTPTGTVITLAGIIAAAPMRLT
jgi:hypothetical protein